MSSAKECLACPSVLTIFGCLNLGYVENSFSFVSAPFLVSQSLLPDYQRLLSSMPSRRLNSSKLIENSGEFPLEIWVIFGLLLKKMLCFEEYYLQFAL